MLKKISKLQPGWLDFVKTTLEEDGCVVLEDVLPHTLLSEAKKRMEVVQKEFVFTVGEAKLKSAGEMGVLRLMMLFDPFFVKFIEIPELLEIIDHTVGNTAIMHLQNGFILPSFPKDTPRTFQNTYHRDFPRWMNGYVSSINSMIAVDRFTEENGATRVVLGSHKWEEPKTQSEMEKLSCAAECSEGAIVLFNSMVWHAAGKNHSGTTRNAINQQFTRSFFKQQLDYVRALGGEFIKNQKPRTQQLLGYWTRLPSALNEYYVPEEERLYRKGQG